MFSPLVPTPTRHKHRGFTTELSAERLILVQAMEALLQPTYTFDSLAPHQSAGGCNSFIPQKAGEQVWRLNQSIGLNRECYHMVALDILSISCPAVPPLNRAADHGGLRV